MKITRTQVTAAHIGLFLWTLFAVQFIANQNKLTIVKAGIFLSIVLTNLLFFVFHRSFSTKKRAKESAPSWIHLGLLLPFLSGASAFIIFVVTSLAHQWMFSFAFGVISVLSLALTGGMSSVEPKETAKE